MEAAEIISQESEELRALIQMIKKAEQAVETASKVIRPTIGDEHYMIGDEVCEKLHISRRTLQSLRDSRLIPFTTIGGKILYPESGLFAVLKQNYHDFRLWIQ